MYYQFKLEAFCRDTPFHLPWNLRQHWHWKHRYQPAGKTGGPQRWWRNLHQFSLLLQVSEIFTNFLRLYCTCSTLLHSKLIRLAVEYSSWYILMFLLEALTCFHWAWIFTCISGPNTWFYGLWINPRTHSLYLLSSQLNICTYLMNFLI